TYERKRSDQIIFSQNLASRGPSTYEHRKRRKPLFAGRHPLNINRSKKRPAREDPSPACLTRPWAGYQNDPVI
ncbi:hypothetical protein, partial [Mesorhizobium sp. B3-2-1]|uniref:hypothetical protein n=1 Tax=Mesorhizobium sp. B3-2-1 TaxID=2589891 RepID=UPI001AEE98F6